MVDKLENDDVVEAEEPTPIFRGASALEANQRIIKDRQREVHLYSQLTQAEPRISDADLAQDIVWWLKRYENPFDPLPWERTLFYLLEGGVGKELLVRAGVSVPSIREQIEMQEGGYPKPQWGVYAESQRGAWVTWRASLGA
jgi:hypothetical protein